ncbi:MAG TPA: PAS domain S-box protein [Nitrospira sp.]|nr:PAS domain S-box protein [Nitrospira sp.]
MPEVCQNVTTGSVWVRRHGRLVWYGATAILFVLLSALLPYGSWRGDPYLHRMAETASSLTAVMVGVMALTRYYSRKETTFLFLGTAFLGTGILDAYHAMVTSPDVVRHLPSSMTNAVPWSWLSSRLFLAFMLGANLVCGYRSPRNRSAGPLPDWALYPAAMVVLLASCGFVFVLSLPPAIHPDRTFPRIQELLIAALFLPILIGHLHQGAWRRHAFDHWFTLGILVELLTHACVMARSAAPHDAFFIAAHFTKPLGYLCVLTGLLINTHELFRKLERSMERNQHDQIQLRQAHAKLEQRVFERTEELEASRRFVASVVEHLPSMVFVKDAHTLRYVQFNRAGEELTGWSRDELIGKTVYDVLPKDDADCFMERDRALLTSRTLLEIPEEEIETRHRGTRLFRTRKIPLCDRNGVPQYIVGISDDVTEQRVAERTLAKVRELQEAILSNAPYGIMTTDQRGIFTSFNPAAEQMLGYQANEVIGSLSPDAFDADKSDTCASRLQGNLDGEIRCASDVAVGKSRQRMSGQHEWTFRRRDSTIFPVMLSITAFRNEAGAITGHLYIVSDLTERKAADERFRSIVEGTPTGIVMVDPDGDITLVNRQVERQFGYDRAEILGQSLDLLLPGQFRMQDPASKSFFDHPVSGPIGAVRESVARRRDGTDFPVEMGLSPIWLPTGLHVLASVMDLSERKQTEQRLALQAEVSAILAQSIEPDQALLDILACLCRHLAWSVGQLWIVDNESDILRSAQRWTAEPDRFESFLDLSRSTTFTRGQGLPGRVWEKESPVWIPDITLDPNFPRAGTARQVGLRGALALPVRLSGKVEAVVEWFSTTIPEPDPGLLDILSAIGVQIGGFIARVRADESLRRYLERTRLILDHALDAVVTIDEQGLICEWNARAESMFGWPAAEAIGRDIADTIIPLQHRDAHRRGMARYRFSGTGPVLNRRLEITALRRTGEEFPVELAIASIQTTGRKLISAFISDITARRCAEQARLTLQEAINYGMDGMALLDAEGRFTYLNPAYAEMYGFQVDELLGKSWKDLFSPEWVDLIEQLSKPDVEQHGRWQGEVVAVTRTGNRIHVELSLVILDRDRTRGSTLASTCRDITRRKDMERDLIAAKDAAEAAARAKAEFLATMSHEIRTPMNGVIGMTGLLLDTSLTGEQRGYAETVRRSGEALLAIINDILDFSKIEAGKLTLEHIEFDLRTTVEETLDLLAEQAHRKQLEIVGLIDASVPTALRGDPGRLRQVITNLAGNAIKFTEQGEVVVRLTTAGRDARSVTLRFEVADTGIGIAAEDQSRLFQPFSQADGSTTRKFGGTGLGLAISRQLVEAMGGQIGVVSHAGQGSTFWFTVRLEPQSEPIPLLASPTLAGLRMCLIDDNATNRMLLEYHARSWGITHASAESGRRALELLREGAVAGHAFDVALIDMEMPGMDGMELARRIKAESTLQSTRLILLTSLARRGDAKLAHDRGFSAYLTKPIHQHQLYDCLRLVMGGSDTEISTHDRLITVHSVAEVQSRQAGRILLAEDNVINQKVAVNMIEKLGYQVDVVANGEEAIEALSRIAYILIFMDCHMPEMDGYEATRRIRAREASLVKREASESERRYASRATTDASPSVGRVPIVAMTANAMQGDRELCLAAGMDDYVSKPISAKALKTALDRWIAPRSKGSAAADPSDSSWTFDSAETRH